MDPKWLRQLLASVANGSLSLERAARELSQAPALELGYATVDTQRRLRQGMPEVVLAQGKTADDIAGVARGLLGQRQNVLITRLHPELAEQVVARVPELVLNALARTARYEFPGNVSRLQLEHPVLVVTAGTSDLPVAEEALETLAAAGVPAERVADVGVAGIHRVLKHHQALQTAAAIICVAGMEGALPSVVAGLTRVPVIAVPTSVGYGVALGGLTALFGMLTSCAAGVTVVNIDNGFGAAMAIIRQLRREDVL
jgi:pyridinium-3,5-biscarboxylic acid mononucleotide synthase